MKYQIDYGVGFIDIDPVGPDGFEVSPDDFFDYLAEEGTAVRARVLSGRSVIAEVSFGDEEEEEEDDLDDEDEEE